jgi:hypothetical protein
LICLKRILEKLENKNSFKKKKGCLENDPKTFKEKKENIEASFNSNSDNKIMIVKAIEKAKWLAKELL